MNLKERCKSFEKLIWEDGKLSLDVDVFSVKAKRFLEEEYHIETYSQLGRHDRLAWSQKVIQRMFRELRHSLHWVRRYNGLVPRAWWKIPFDGEAITRDSFNPSGERIEIDLKIAQAFNIPMQSALLDASLINPLTRVVELVARTQILDADQLAIINFWQISTDPKFKLSISENREVMKKFREDVISSQLKLGNSLNIVNSGQKLYTALWEGPISRENLDRLKRRFVPEYVEMMTQ